MTNTTKPELLALADRVERGGALHHEVMTALSYDSGVVFSPLQSMDSAERMQQDVLRGWVLYELNNVGGTWSVVLHYKPGRGRISDVSGSTYDDPALAWVAAILRAKAGELS